MKEEIDRAGDSLENEPTIVNFKKFRYLISAFAKKVPSDAYHLEIEGSAGQRSHEIITVIDKEADALYHLIMQEQKDHIKITAQIMIKGLVVDFRLWDSICLLNCCNVVLENTASPYYCFSMRWSFIRLNGRAFMKRLWQTFFKLVLLSAGLFFSSAASAAVGQWTSLGPWGGDVECLATTGSTIYAGTQNGGVFRSSDGGVTWSAANTGLDNPTVYALAIDYGVPEMVYAGTAGDGIYKSNDGGTSWSKLVGAPPSVYSLAVDPADGTVYAGTGGSGIYKSALGGSTWTAANTGMATAYVYAIGLDPNLTTTVYAATDSGIYRIMNGETAWSKVANSGRSRDLAIFPTNPATIYVATGTGVIKSTGGTTWSNAGLSGSSVYSLAISPSDPAMVVAGTTTGIFHSADSGTNWTAALTGPATTVQSVTFDPSDSSSTTLIAGTHGGGMYKSTNAGSDWQNTNHGLANTFVQAVITHSGAGAAIYTATNNGIFKSTDGGALWATASAGLDNGDVEALVINPASPNQLYAGTWGNGVYKTIDGGTNWSVANTGMASALVHALAIDPNNAQNLYAGTSAGIYKSSTGGGSWGLCSNGIPADAEVWSVLATANSAVYAGTGSGFYRSDNGGGSWIQSNTGLPACGVVYGIAVAPGAAADLYAATCGGVYKSTDGGSSWNFANTGMTTDNVFNLTVTATAPITLYAGTDSGVFVSQNGAASWSPLNTGLTNSDVYGFAAISASPASLYAGTWGGGVFAMTSSQDITASPAGLELGYRLANQNSATQAVTISNGGETDIIVSSITLSGGGAAAFSANPGTCSSLTPTIAPGGSCTVAVTFTPTSGQDYLASLDIQANSAVTPLVNVILTGSGAYPLSVLTGGIGIGTISVSAPPPVDAGLSCAPGAVYCGAHPGGTSITLTPQPLEIYKFSGWSGCPMSMGDSCFITINGAVNATAYFSEKTLQEIIDTATSSIRLPFKTYVDAVVMNRSGVALSLSGGWNNDFSLQGSSFTSIAGSLTIANGTLTLENIQII